MHCEHLKIYGDIKVDIGDKRYETSNIKTNLYRTYHANWLANDYPITYSTGSPSVGRYSIAIGTGSVDSAASDTALGNEVFRKAVSTRYVVRTYTSRFMTTFTNMEPPVPPGSTNINLYEYGLFDEAPITVVNSSLGSWSAGSPVGWIYSGCTISGTAGTAYLYEPSGSAAQVVRTSGTAQVYQNITFDNSWRSQSITFRMAVKEATKSGSQSMLYIYDGVSYSYGNTHPGGEGTPYSLMTVTKTLDGTAGTLQVGAMIKTGTAWLDWANLTPDGKLLARGTISIDKGSTQPMNLIWDIHLDEIEDDIEMGYNGYALENVNVGTASAGSLGTAYYAPSGSASAERAIVSIETYPIRYMYHGGTPTSGSGHIAGTGDVLSLTGFSNIQNFKAISTGSGSAKLTVTYER